MKSLHLLRHAKSSWKDPGLNDHDRPLNNQPLPVNLDTVREAIHSSEPARAAIAALVAFHALRSGELVLAA